MTIEIEDGRRVAIFETDNGRIKIDLASNGSLPRLDHEIASRNPGKEMEFPTREGGTLRVPDLGTIAQGSGSKVA